MFVDTLKEIFEGNQKLFEGLYIHDKWDWTKKYPVIKLDFAGGEVRSREELDIRMLDMLEENDDVQDVYANFDIDESIMQEID